VNDSSAVLHGADGQPSGGDHVLPEQPIRHWVISFPYPLRFLSRAHRARLLRVIEAIEQRS